MLLVLDILGVSCHDLYFKHFSMLRQHITKQNEAAISILRGSPPKFLASEKLKITRRTYKTKERIRV